MLPVSTQGPAPRRRRLGAVPLDDTLPALGSNPGSAKPNEEGGPSDG